MKSIFSDRWRTGRWVALAILLLAAVTLYSLGQSPVPAVKTVDLADGPLFVSSNGDKPTLTLALSVEFPTVGAQYVWDPAVSSTGANWLDDSYRNAIEYLGYYDAEACYVYNNNPGDAIPSGMAKADLKRFDRSGPAVKRQCPDAFSGNFLNWASSSAVDMLRLALSGGDRYIDTDKLTVLQRAIVPSGDPLCMWNGNLFPVKKLSRIDGGSNRFYGAIPQSMIKAAGSHDIWIANMLERIYFSAADGPSGYCNDTGGYQLSSSAGLSSEGYLYARVSVCSHDDNGVLLDKRDYGLCTAYPSGHYKPTGVVQKYSDKVRLAAFGYLMDQTPSWGGGRYGGVLRAPMKFVGQNTFDIHGVKNTPAGGNPNAEWDKTTGVFSINPDSDRSQTPGISGVINYLNKFGRTGSVKGRYKVYDPVSELYYQALRYLQGLPPTPAATSGITPAMYDGFPVFDSWSDPYGNKRSNDEDYSCGGGNIVLIGDVGTNDGDHIPVPSAANNIVDIVGWTATVRNFELNNVSGYLDGSNTARVTSNPNGQNAGVPYNGVIGMSYWAHSHDIRGKAWTAEPALQRPGLRIKSFFFDVNQFGAETNAAHRRSTNQFFMASKYGGYETNAGENPFNSYGNPFRRDNGIPENAVWQKPEDPGEAKTYYLQSSARGVLAAFDEIFNKAGIQARSIAGTARQSPRISAAGNVFYQSAFRTGDWSGDVLAMPVSLNTGTTGLSVGTTPYWSASAKLLASPEPATTRNIQVGRPGGNALPNATAFNWAAVKGSPMERDLNRPDSASAADGLGQDRLLYLRGDRSKEGRPFRVRTKLLGDVVNSGVAYSGTPSGFIPSSSYLAFSDAHKNRTPAVFVGANDGMLHAFDATVSQQNSGKELFAYIPSWMSPKLSALTSPDYADAHQSYVDGSPTVADAQVAQNGSATDWRTVLVSGTGAGGKGVFALDVSDPASFSADDVMWEFSAADDADMGYVVGKPQILKIRKNDLSEKTPIYGWYAVVPGGVNNNAPDAGGYFSVTGNPALFLLDLTKPKGASWVLGNNYFKVMLPTDASLSAKLAPGLVNFTPSLNSANAVEKIYAGDLHGNVWKLNFAQTKQGAADWNMAKLSSFNRGSTGNTAFPLYAARDALGAPQPITSAPMLVRGEARGATYVAVGTGKYLEKSDNINLQTNSVYAIFDTDLTVPPDASSGPQISGRGRMRMGTLSSDGGTISMAPFSWGHASSDTDTGQRSGWYFDFPVTGEREITSASIFGDSLIFGSIVANATGGGQTCTAGGTGFEYQVNIDTGAGTRAVSKVGIMGQPFMMELPSATTYAGALDNTGQQTKILRSQSFQQGSQGIAASSQMSLSVAVGRLSWRQINNYQELKNEATP